MVCASKVAGIDDTADFETGIDDGQTTDTYLSRAEVSGTATSFKARCNRQEARTALAARASRLFVGHTVLIL